MKILGIETSCDETAAAVCIDGEIISTKLSSQEIHNKFGGVIPELASREHEKVIKLCNSKKIDKCIFIGQIFYRLKNNNSSNYFYKNKGDFFENNNHINETNILIKGSRGMKMEEIFNRIL